MKEGFSDFKKAAIIASLQNCRLFSGLNRDDLEKIAAITVVKSFNKGDYIFREGDESHGFYVVQKGSINIHRVNKLGREQVIHIFRNGESFAEASMSMEGGYPADARAEEPSQLLLIQKNGFKDLLRTQPELTVRMFVSMSIHLRNLVEQLEEISLQKVENRLANWLLKRCPTISKPVTIEIEVPKRVLAAELGTVSETLSRTFAKFKNLGLIEVKGKRIEVLNPRGLDNIIHSEYERE
ncbi:MAG TPA: Crp/Fnr family transcriptional regulator [Verrucomicrobiota bacterium]|nr:Crp/Fnr family transcriptional regulator [Verrucomicrobiota bacterium]